MATMIQRKKTMIQRKPDPKQEGDGDDDTEVAVVPVAPVVAVQPVVPVVPVVARSDDNMGTVKGKLTSDGAAESSVVRSQDGKIPQRVKGSVPFTQSLVEAFAHIPEKLFRSGQIAAQTADLDPDDDTKKEGDGDDDTEKEGDGDDDTKDANQDDEKKDDAEDEEASAFRGALPGAACLIG